MSAYKVNLNPTLLFSSAAITDAHNAYYPTVKNYNGNLVLIFYQYISASSVALNVYVVTPTGQWCNYVTPNFSAVSSVPTILLSGDTFYGTDVNNGTQFSFKLPSTFTNGAQLVLTDVTAYTPQLCANFLFKSGPWYNGNEIAFCSSDSFPDVDYYAATIYQGGSIVSQGIYGAEPAGVSDSAFTGLPSGALPSIANLPEYFNYTPDGSLCAVLRDANNLSYIAAYNIGMKYAGQGTCLTTNTPTLNFAVSFVERFTQYINTYGLGYPWDSNNYNICDTDLPGIIFLAQGEGSNFLITLGANAVAFSFPSALTDSISTGAMQGNTLYSVFTDSGNITRVYSAPMGDWRLPPTIGDKFKKFNVVNFVRPVSTKGSFRT